MYVTMHAKQRSNTEVILAYCMRSHPSTSAGLANQTLDKPLENQAGSPSQTPRRVSVEEHIGTGSEVLLDPHGLHALYAVSSWPVAGTIFKHALSRFCLL